MSGAQRAAKPAPPATPEGLTEELARQLIALQASPGQGTDAALDALELALAEGAEGAGPTAHMLRQHMLTHAGEIEAAAHRIRMEGGSLDTLASQLAHDALLRLARELPDASLDGVLEILKAARAVKEAQVRAEVARRTDDDDLPLLVINIGKAAPGSAQAAAPHKRATQTVVDAQAREITARPNTPRLRLLEGAKPLLQEEDETWED